MAEPLLTPNAERVLAARYLRRDAERRIIETPAELFLRVARGVAHAELLLGDARRAAAWEEAFHELMTSLVFLPNSPTLMNAGTPSGQLSACFVLPVEDSMEGIFGTLRHMALIQATGGGTGFAFSRLRPRGSVIRSSGGQSPGPVAFARIYDCATEHIRLGGKRRGANMGVLRVDHPDIREFIAAKLDGSLRNFNLSVAVTDAYMESAARGAGYELVDPRTGAVTGTLDAAELFDAIVDAAWRVGDPGLLFLDAIERANPTPQRGEIEATNPCGEIPLLPYESCNLGSINLPALVRDTADGPELDEDRLREVAAEAVRFLDDVIEVNRYLIPETRRMTLGNRKIGLGVMGFAELLVRLGVSYDSDPAVEIAERLARSIATAAEEASAELAAERGAFPFWRGSALERAGRRVRNATRTAVAPTGTISIVAGTSPGIEPFFALAFRRTHVLEEETLTEVNRLLIAEAERQGLPPREVAGAAATTGRIGDAPGIPDALKRLFVTALEIPPERHLEIQAAWQRHVDNSVSKTINLPETASRDDVARIYRRAWELGLKGITLFRHGSKGVQVVEPGVPRDSMAADRGGARAA